MSRLTSFRETNERYPSLRIIVTILTGLGALLLVLGGLLLVLGLMILAGFAGGAPTSGNPFQGQPTNSLPILRGLSGMAGIVWGVGLLFSALECLAVGGLLRLAIHVEENTRASAQSLAKLCDRTESRREEISQLFVS